MGEPGNEVVLHVGCTLTFRSVCEKGLDTSQVAHQTGANAGFSNIKLLEVSLLSPE